MCLKYKTLSSSCAFGSYETSQTHILARNFCRCNSQFFPSQFFPPGERFGPFFPTQSVSSLLLLFWKKLENDICHIMCHCGVTLVADRRWKRIHVLEQRMLYETAHAHILSGLNCFQRLSADDTYTVIVNVNWALKKWKFQCSFSSWVVKAHDDTHC